MDRIAQVKINWLSFEEGGRKEPPSGKIYKPNLKFINSVELWSIAIFLDEEARGDFVDNDTVSVAFISDIFPFDQLLTLKKFEVTEGPKKVADCELISLTIA